MESLLSEIQIMIQSFWHILSKYDLNMIFFSQHLYLFSLLFRSKESKAIVRKSCFDGFYTSNASNGANFFSTFKNWEKLKKFAEMYNLIFVPTVSPGFHDAKAKYNPLRRVRVKGQYFESKKLV